jgi:hypothetical protein
MKNLTFLFKTVEIVGGSIWLEGEKLKYRLPSLQSNRQNICSLLNELKNAKGYIISYLDFEEKVKMLGWGVISRLDAYEFKLTRKHSIFIFASKTEWIVWRATWRYIKKKNKEGDEYEEIVPKPFKEKTIKETSSLKNAFDEANKYIGWYKKRVEKVDWKQPTLKEIYDAPPSLLAN